MNLTRKQIKQERHKLLVKELYGAWKLDKDLSEENIEALKEFDYQVSTTESVQIRIDALREMNITLQEKYFDKEIENLIRVMEEEESSKTLIAKEYASLEDLKTKNQEARQEQEKEEVDQVKLNEDGHSRMPVQTLALIEEDTNEKELEQS